MDVATFFVQCLNALQYGLLLFLVASGLTLIFGVMGVINLAHGSFYMFGAYMVYALAPDRKGALLWQVRIASPAPNVGTSVGVQWGMATDGTNVYVAGYTTSTDFPAVVLTMTEVSEILVTVPVTCSSPP